MIEVKMLVGTCVDEEADKWDYLLIPVEIVTTEVAMFYPCRHPFTADDEFIPEAFICTCVVLKSGKYAYLAMEFARFKKIYDKEIHPST